MKFAVARKKVTCDDDTMNKLAIFYPKFEFFQGSLYCIATAFHTHKLHVDSGPFLVLGSSGSLFFFVIFGGGGNGLCGGPRTAEVEFQLTGEEGPQVAGQEWL